MNKGDRTRACYLHACLRYVQRDIMTNNTPFLPSVRGLKEELEAEPSSGKMKMKEMDNHC